MYVAREGAYMCEREWHKILQSCMLLAPYTTACIKVAMPFHLEMQVLNPLFTYNHSLGVQGEEREVDDDSKNVQDCPVDMSSRYGVCSALLA